MIDLRTQAIRLIDGIGFTRAEQITKGELHEHVLRLRDERMAYGRSPDKIERKDGPIAFPANHISRGVI